MNNPEMIELKNKFILGLLIALVIAIPFLLLFSNKLTNFNSKVYNEIRKDKSFLVLFIDSPSCNNCNSTIKTLNDLDIKYYKYDIKKENDYTDILKELNIKEELVEVPALIYIKNGKMEANMMNISKTEDILDFLEFYNYVQEWCYE